MASHYRGGEITWTCQGNGMYMFHLKFYRDCNGIPGPAAVILSTSIPGTPSINMSLVQQFDISPGGLQANGTTACANCSQGNGGSPIPGLVEMYEFQSAPIFLTGVPPVIGWIFSWGECCRSNLDNISGAAGIGFGLKAIMYPLSGQNTNPCFDSSPYFAEIPEVMFCTGYPVTYNQYAIDPERDSMVYSWGVPFDDFLNSTPFAPGYSVNSQLPGPIQNPLNTGVSLDPVTGAISFTSFTGGVFMTKIVVTTYKNGSKSAEIFREIAITLNNNCAPVWSGQNLPPDVNAPFFDPVTGLQTAFIDTVFAGDTVDFLLSISDFDIFTNGSGQTITVTAVGDLFGSNFTNPSQGCPQPPCATLSNPVPLSFSIGGNIQFNWVTTEDHLFAPGNQHENNRYNFTITARDNYCPANGVNTSTISIIIQPRQVLLPPVLRCAVVNNDGSVSLNWTKTPSFDSLNLFEAYNIYASLSAGGPFQFVDSVNFAGINSTMYTHSTAALTSLFGVNASQQRIYYRAAVQTYGAFNYYWDPSNIMSTIKLNVVQGTGGQPQLNWNAASSPQLPSQSSFYQIYREYPIGTWNLIGSTAALTFTDVTAQTLCNDSVSYRIELQDTSGCNSVSDVSGILVNSSSGMSAISPVNPSFCSGGSVILSAPSGYIYTWSTGATSQSIVVNNGGTYSVTVSNGTGCSVTGSALVTVYANPAPVITGTTIICQGTTTTLNAGSGYSTYQWSNGNASQTVSVGAAGIYTVTVTNLNGCSGTDTIFVFVNPLPIVAAQANGNTSFCQGDSVQLSVPANYVLYQWYRFNFPVVPFVFQPNYQAKTYGYYKCKVTDFNGCTNYSNSIFVDIPCIPIDDEIEKEGSYNDEIEWEVYPNPSDGDFYLKGAAINLNEILITDLAGKQINFITDRDPGNPIRISGLKQGVYLLRIPGRNGTEVLKLVKVQN